MFSHSYFLWIGEISEKSGGSGGSFGLTYDTDQWKLEEFTTKENAYSLCEFTGKHVHVNAIYGVWNFNINNHINRFHLHQFLTICSP